jgi:hypothetical protein
MRACIDGYNAAQGAEEPPPKLTAAEYDDMMSRNADWIFANRGAKH